ALMMGKMDIKQASKELNRDFDSIVELHKIKESFTTTESDVVSKIVEEYSSKETCLSLFHNSLALAWIDHIETKYPILRAVSSKKLDHMVSELQQANREKRIASRDILLLKSRERTYAGVEYNRLNNRTTYRDLQHQVTKKRRIWPIRRVISAYSEELFNLLPCWMASPESASAIFPMERYFDLVIFDEASQCFSERGLPAMARGHQIVVAGDDKQLQPNDLYRVRWDEENEEDIPELEVDSLLDLAKKYVPEVSLQGHYRSKSLQLIEFSNERFYNGKLKMLPHFDVANDPEPCIHYVKVEGIWENNVNDMEAGEVVKIVKKLVKSGDEKSIAIVTFNAKQQNHVMDVLEEAAIKEGFLIPENLIIKNIENIQGDERDVVIFSTAYGPDKSGKLRLQFGMLNQKGGENRLNVAVTRAKEEIYLVTSIHPNELNTEEAKNPGPRFLKEYLEYAFNISKKKWKPAPHKDESRGQDWYLRNQLPNLVNEPNLKLE
ncbi:MAG: DEAD/DEAH box helicase, partial [Cyclobacteriaceae bacterium]